MLFTDTIFLLLFAAVWFVVQLLRPWPAVREWFLIGFSFLVIASWGTFDLVLFLGVVLVNFIGSLAISRSDAARGRGILTLFIALDLATLAVFKYSNFAGQTIGQLTHLALPAFPLGIPLAISFYTFHLISYLVDLHARRVRLASFRGYLFYLSFFPHVIAGPITRAWQLVPQIGRTRRIRTDFAMGFHFLVTGFFLKAVVANNIAATIDPFWRDEQATPLEHWIVAFLYYCQIYGDFAGYSLMALGMARLLGYRLPANFRSPMRAATLQEFWQRWHITLSRWLRDYLYIPLGGNRVTAARSARNVIITMLLGGLWHGAGWGFILWGGMHGLGLVVERRLGFNRTNHGLGARLAWALAVQLWVITAWVFFRAPHLGYAVHYFHHMFVITRPGDLAVRPMVIFCLVLAVPVVAHNFFPLLLRAAGRKRLPWILAATTAFMLYFNLVIFSPSTAFIYFRF